MYLWSPSTRRHVVGQCRPMFGMGSEIEVPSTLISGHGNRLVLVDSEHRLHMLQ